MRKPSDSKDGIDIGNFPYSASDRVFIKQSHRKEHMLVMGRSGWGKTYFIENLIREDILAGRGVCVLDPSGDLYNRLVKFCHRKRFKKNLRDRLILINPHDENSSIGLNYLEITNPTATATSQTLRVSRGISKAFADEKLEEKPRLDHWLHSTLRPLIKAGLTLKDGYLFLTEQRVRDKILEQLHDADLIREWEQINKLKYDKQLDFLESVFNRFKKFNDGDCIRYIISHQNSTINFRKAMDEGAVILVNLAEGGRLSAPEAKLLGIMLIDSIAEAANSRWDIPVNKRHRMYFYIDEFHKYVCDDVAKGLKELRKYGLSFVLASQNIVSMQRNEFELYSAIQQGTTIKVCFSMFSEDAELMINELFPGYLSENQEKRRIYRTFYRQKLGRAKIYSDSETESEGFSSGQGTVDGSVASSSEGLSAPVNDLGLDSGIMIRGTGKSSSSISSVSDSDSKAKTRGHTEIDAPMYYQIEDQEVAQIQDYTPEEKRQFLVSRFANLPKRNAFVKVIGERYDAVPFVTKDLPIKQKPVLASDFKKTIAASNLRSAKSMTYIDNLIDYRRNLLLGRPVEEAVFEEYPELKKLTCYIDQAKDDEDHFDQETYDPDQ